MARGLVAGGGLAGLAAASALAGAGHEVDLLEARPFLGGRATSYPHQDETIDNCQHVLLRCCSNLLDFYRRVGAEDKIRFWREFYFIEPGGRVSTMKAGALPAPLHFSGSFARLRFLSLADKFSIARGMLAIRRERESRRDLDRITMLDWLREKKQTTGAIERFWRQVLVSAVNEELDRMAASHGFQVFHLGFLASSTGYEMGVPSVPLAELYANLPGVRIRHRVPVDRIAFDGARVVGIDAGGERWTAGAYVCAVPFERVNAIAPELGLDFDGWEHSPITGIHLWFDRRVTDLPHATLLDRNIQWMYDKHEGRYLQCVVSASRSLLGTPRAEAIRMAVEELGEFLPLVRQARLEKAHVVKEARATFSAKPGLTRPKADTRFANLFLAGDWTGTGWPATMEGAVRSGYRAAEAVDRGFGGTAKFEVE